MIHSDRHLFGPRPVSGDSLIQQTSSTARSTHFSRTNDEDVPRINLHKRSYRAMLQLILTAVTDDTDYTDLFDDSNSDDDSESNDDDSTSQPCAATTKPAYTTPSIEEVAKQVQKEENIELDEKQNISFKECLSIGRSSLESPRYYKFIITLKCSFPSAHPPRKAFGIGCLWKPIFI